MDNLQLSNSQERAQAAQSWPKRDEKGYSKSESRQLRIKKSTTIAIDGSLFVSRNVQMETSKHLDLLKSLLKAVTSKRS